MGCCCLNRRDSSACMQTSMEEGISAQTYKLEGNLLFQQRNYGAAIKKYLRAIDFSRKNKEPINPTYFTNLALSYKANQQHEQAIKTVDQLLNFSQFNTQDSVHLETIQKGKHIKARSIMMCCRAYCLAEQYNQKESRRHVEQLNLAKTLLVDLSQQSTLNTNQYFQNLEILSKFLRRNVLVRSKAATLTSYIQQRLKKAPLRKEEQFRDVDKVMEELRRVCEKQANLFGESIRDPISYNIFKDPLIVPSGISYDSAVLIEHFKKNSYTDPITKQKYTPGEGVAVKNIMLQMLIREEGAVDRDDIVCIQD